MNNTKVFPAKLYATKDRTDAKVEIFLLRELGDRLWEVLVKPARKVRIGNKLILSKDLFCDVIDNTVSGGRVVRFEFGKQNFGYDSASKENLFTEITNCLFLNLSFKSAKFIGIKFNLFC